MKHSTNGDQSATGGENELILQPPLAKMPKLPEVTTRNIADRVAPEVSDTIDDIFLALLKPKKTIVIAVSGAVMITEMERKIIDTPEFQRLRGVRQLGTAYFVYPTALHTRFDHSIGTLSMVTQMMRSIRENDHNSSVERGISNREMVLARVYALLHDITHVPFGHTIEDELQILQRHDENETRINHFLGPDSTIGKILIAECGRGFYDDLYAIYRWDENPTSGTLRENLFFIHDLVSNTVCADLLDYLKRDDFFCNTGVSMSYNFMNYLYLGEGIKKAEIKATDDGSTPTVTPRRIVVRLWKKEGRPRRDLLSDLCRLLEARYFIAERVYFHHAKIIPSAMLGRALQEAQLAKEISEERMWELSDDTLIYLLTQSKSNVAQQLAVLVKNRHFHHCFEIYTREDIDKEQARSHQQQFSVHVEKLVGDPEARRTMENYLSLMILADPGDVLIYHPTHEMNKKLAEMRVFWKGEPQAFKSIDDPIVESQLESILARHERLWSMRLLVSDKLDNKQKNLAKKLLELEWKVSDEEREEECIKLLEDMVRDELTKNDNSFTATAAIMSERVRSAALELIASNKRPSERGSLDAPMTGDQRKEQLSQILLKYFPEEQNS